MSDNMAVKIGEIVQVHNDNPVKRVPIARPSFGREGKQIKLLSNHFTVKLSGIDAVFYQYSVMDNSEPLRML